jgi:hypothetical protein
MISLAVMPYLISQAIDRGLRPRQAGPLVAWAGAIFVVGVAKRAARHPPAPDHDQDPAGRRIAHG